MFDFLDLFLRLIPFYFYILLGFVAARNFGLNREGVARFLIYGIAPVVVFAGTYRSELNFSYLSLPIIIWLVASITCIIFYKFGKRIFPEDSTANLLGLSAGSGNTGYFGIPVAIMIFGEKIFPLAVLSTLGMILYELTTGFFVAARGSNTIKESLERMKKLPAIYAFGAGIILNMAKIPLGDVVNTTIDQFKGVYTIVGMMMIGMGLATAHRDLIDKKFMIWAFFAKFAVWPLLMSMIIFLDKNLLHLYNNDIYGILILASIVPLAANTVTWATELKAHPEKAAIAVVISTIFALFYIPLIVGLIF
ncbi:MAG TPA: AEC family transporter [Candidatus Pacearchaeota archaeon]|nr:AEC family transporter [Candidatus Parcubacteria bacterium]HNZ84151.1 AEC family transporter [Candidatus Pacearchaeota archaeon]HOU45595.1 AEC family transporter [Candidatus Pacearchaeota archaeon]HPM08553.1 AEC family transporter [Candidatus Pacearchaeota archaeon]HQI74248.1 AEC family transporter [Candidatus Pacearchaeota archaeon]